MTEAAAGIVRRALRNTAARGAAELAGKLITLALLVVLARVEGPAGVGVLVFAIAWTELASIAVDMGFDRHLTRLLAADRSRLGELMWNVLLLKARRAVPVVAASLLLLAALGHDGDARDAVWLLTAGYLVETLRWTLFGVFTAWERGDLTGLVLVVQRLVAGVLGLAALAAGLGVLGVAAAMVVGAAAGVALGVRLLARHVGLPRPWLPRGPREELRRGSRPFAAQEVLSAGLGRLDAVLLALLTSQAVVGVYGAAYRLLEATLLVSTALLGAFSAMYTYLSERSSPTVGAAFGRSLKLSLVLLVPCAVPMAVAPGPLLELVFGAAFLPGADALRLLAPTVLLLGVVMLSASLVAARLDPRLLVRAFGVGVAVNLPANLLLIPPLGGTGAALAMLLSEAVLAVVLLRLALRAVGPPNLVATLGGPALAGALMAAVLLALPGSLPLGLALGAVVYAGALWAVERRVAPGDVDRLRGALLGGRA